MPITRQMSLVVFVCLFVAALWVGPLLWDEFTRSSGDLDPYRNLRASMSIYLLASALAVFLAGAFRPLVRAGQGGLIDWLTIGLKGGLKVGLIMFLIIVIFIWLMGSLALIGGLEVEPIGFDSLGIWLADGLVKSLSLGVIGGLIIGVIRGLLSEFAPARQPAPAPLLTS